MWFRYFYVGAGVKTYGVNVCTILNSGYQKIWTYAVFQKKTFHLGRSLKTLILGLCICKIT